MAETVLGPVIRSSLFKGIFGTSATPIPAFSPINLFSTGSQGIWLDPSDLSTMFSDRAGTTPVTTPGTVVGLRLDKSKGLALGAELVVNGDFPVNTTGWAVNTAGPTLSWDTQRAKVVVSGVGQGITQTSWSPVAGRWYRVVYTATNGAAAARGFSATFAGGDGGGGTVNAGQSRTFSTMVLATSTANLVVRNAGGDTVSGETFFYDNISVRELAGNHAVAPTDAARPIYGVEPKGGRRNLLLNTDTLATQSLTVTAVAHTLSFTGTGTVTLSGASIAGPLIGTGAGNRVSLTFTPTAASLTLTVVGSVTLGQLELGSSVTAYQKVVTAYNVTESGVATTHYVQYDGSDDSMSTAAIDFTGTDKMSVFAGVLKSSNALTAMLFEISTTLANGSLNLIVPQTTATGAMRANSRGTVTATVNGPSQAAPAYFLATIQSDIAGDNLLLRLDGTQVAQATTDQGTGNFGSHALFIGRRNNASLPFNGRDFGLIIVGKAASAGEITNTETWLAAKTSGVTL